MNTSQPQSNNISDSDLALLSAYIDQQLNAAAQAELEQRIASDPYLRAELEELRATTALLRALPPLAPPRSFTLDPARAPRRRSLLPTAWFMQLGGGLAGLALVLLASLQMLGGVGASMATAPLPMMEAVPQSAPAPMAAAIAPTETLVTTLSAAPTAETMAAVMAADNGAPAATQAPTAMAMIASDAPTTTGPGARQASASAPPSASGMGGGGSYPSVAADAASAATAMIMTTEPVESALQYAEAASAPAAKAAPQQPALPPTLILSLGMLLLALSVGSFFYSRRR